MENKFGRFKDYIKGIIFIAVGFLLIIIGIVWIEILPLAIILWVIGTPTFINGVRLIVHNKKNNTIVSAPRSSSSSSSSSTSDTINDWEYKFKEAIENVHFGGASVSASTNVSGNVIEVTAAITPTAWTGAGEEADSKAKIRNYEDTVFLVKTAYKKIAKKCPFSSNLYTKMRD